MLVWSHQARYPAQTMGTSQQLEPPAWRVFPGTSPYSETVRAMEQHADAVARGDAEEQIWLVEHPAVVTAGTSAAHVDLLQPGRFPVVEIGRGGRHTYHGPGQRVIYPIIHLGHRGRDVRRFVTALEQWAIAALAEFGVPAFPHTAGTGIWVQTDAGAAKIGAIGVRIRRWVSFHGMAINVTTDLQHFDAIVPCGIEGRGVARLADLAPGATMAGLDAALRNTLPTMLHFLSGPVAPPIKTLETRSDCS
jgi:lipoyl(octanoyl) transferase